MSLLLPDSGLLFWMFLSFGIVFVILAKYGFPVIIKMVEGRKTYIDQSLEVARDHRGVRHRSAVHNLPLYPHTLWNSRTGLR